MNKLYEFGSPVDIILRTKTETTIGGITYQPNQIYTIMRDCAISFSYDVVSTSMLGKLPIFAADIQNLPTSVAVSNMPINDKIANLIFSRLDSRVFYRTKTCTLTIENGEGYLPDMEITDLKLYESGVLLANNLFSVVDGAVTAPTLHGSYFAEYQVQQAGTQFAFTSEYYPYFSLEIQSTGNTNKMTNKIYMKFPAVSITQSPQLDMFNDSVFSSPFVFNVIYKGQELPVIIFEE